MRKDIIVGGDLKSTGVELKDSRMKASKEGTCWVLMKHNSSGTTNEIIHSLDAVALLNWNNSDPYRPHWQ